MANFIFGSLFTLLIIVLVFLGINKVKKENYFKTDFEIKEVDSDEEAEELKKEADELEKSADPEEV